MDPERTDGAAALPRFNPDADRWDVPGLLRLPFERPGAGRRFLIGMGMAVLPVVGAYGLQGYAIQTARARLRDPAAPLPDWSDFAGLVADGFRAFVVTFVYALPARAVGMFLAAGGSSGPAGSGPFNPGLAQTALELIAYLLLPFALLQVAADRFGAAFRIGQIVGVIRRHTRLYLGLLGVLALPGVVFVGVSVIVGSLTESSGMGFWSAIATLMLPLVLTGYWASAVMGAAAGFAGRRFGIRPRDPGAERILSES